MDLGISGRVALVTGASKGLGLGIAEALAREGATVAISSRSEERIMAAAGSIGARSFVHDNARPEAASELVRRVEAELGQVDIVVLNSGGPPASPDALTFSLEQWRSAYEMLLLGAIALAQAALPGMRRRGWGRVLSVSSSVVREPSPILALSAAHRAGLLAALKTIARQVAADGVTVNTLLPGAIATDRARELGADSADRVAQIPAGRIGTVEEFAAAAAFLCSGQAAYITGSTLLVDGGATHSV
jgi:3-oxoacyl-[acyl-carrier protein] reductase